MGTSTGLSPVLVPMNKNIMPKIGMLILAICVITNQATIIAADSNAAGSNVQELVSYLTKEKKGREPLLWKHVPGNGDLSSPDYVTHYETVIVTKKKERVTLQYFPKLGGLEPRLSLWWRPDGTSGTSTMWTSAVGMDGVTSGGVDPDKEKSALLDLDRSSDRLIGAEHRQFWQDLCDAKVRQALDYFKRK